MVVLLLNNQSDMHVLLIRFTRLDFHLTMYYVLFLSLLSFSLSVASVHMLSGGCCHQGSPETQN